MMTQKVIYSSIFVLCLYPFIHICGCGTELVFTEPVDEIGWHTVNDRTWIGPEFWANRLQDWQVANGRVESVNARQGKPMRTLHVLTKRLGDRQGSFKLQVRTGIVSPPANAADDAASGFLIGAAPDVDYRSAGLVQCSPGPGGGIFAGIDTTGALFIKDFTKPLDQAENQKADIVVNNTQIGPPMDITLRLVAIENEGSYTLELSAYKPGTSNKLTGLSTGDIAPELLRGSIALVANPGKANNTTFWFNDLQILGPKIEINPDRTCGPVITSQYTLTNNVMKLTAQLMPLGMQDNQSVTLEIKDGPDWKTIATSEIITPGWTAPFRIDEWDSTKDTPYRVVYQMQYKNGASEEHYYCGTIRHDPVEKEIITVAGFTGNHNVRHPGVERGSYTWTDDYLWFPHSDIVSSVKKQNPDLLFFSGDQVYEGASPTDPDKSGEESSYYDYLYKWYLWCWAYSDLTKDIPAVTIPDDHDVFQGNLWGAGGRKTDKDDKGGYVMPSDWVRMVERTQTSHLPDAFDPGPYEQGITAYFTDVKVGRVSFAVLEDRKFKSGPNGLCPPTSSSRADHVIDPDFDISKADVPGAKLLGDNQLNFIRHWAQDWENVDMKATLSQTIFAGMATHHGPSLSYLVADYDSNGWPQSGRNRALAEIRKAFGFMIGGDQHLSTIVQHGIDSWDDAGWSFCVPSVANFYPRKWAPAGEPQIVQEGLQEYTGRYLDGLGNHVTVWAHTNPRPMGHQPENLHDNMPGYGIVKFNKKDRTITMECWPRFADPADPDAKQYTGWPKTITQADNYAREPYGYLPELIIKNMKNPVVQVIDEANKEIIYTIRITGDTYRPKVFRESQYTVKIGMPSTGKIKTIRRLQAWEEGQAKERINIIFD